MDVSRSHIYGPTPIPLEYRFLLLFICTIGLLLKEIGLIFWYFGDLVIQLPGKLGDDL